MTYKTYADVFWGGDLRSIAGSDALKRRNQESKKMCQELEDYLKKRSKIEADYGNSLQTLAKCVRQRDEVGVIEAGLNRLKYELEMMAQTHRSAAVFYEMQSDKLKKFKTDQSTHRKWLEDSLNKAQASKLTQLEKTIQLERTYLRKYCDRDMADLCLKDVQANPTAAFKDLEKASSKAKKADDEAEKSEIAYKSAVKVLEDCTSNWQKEMITACQSIQELDEERINFFRKELWEAVNMASKIALVTDNSSEAVREILEKCDIQSDIQAFMESAKTGEDRPEPFTFKHYTKLQQLAAGDTETGSTESVFHAYCHVNEGDDSHASSEPSALSSKIGFPRARLPLKKKPITS